MKNEFERWIESREVPGPSHRFTDDVMSRVMAFEQQRENPMEQGLRLVRTAATRRWGRAAVLSAGLIVLVLRTLVTVHVKWIP
ncbi:MAG: hypothetical protein AAF492_12985 [Verrucomicrobiota bacterium]